MRRIHIPKEHRADLLKVCEHLPYHPEVELGGYITRSSIYYKVGTEDSIDLPNKDVLFHTHPRREYADIPSPHDVLNFIFIPCVRSIIWTDKNLIVMTKDEVSVRIIKKIDKIHEANAFKIQDKVFNGGLDKAFHYLMHKYNPSLDPILKRTKWIEQWKYYVKKILKIDLQVWVKA